jgi:hypothetical protein
MLVKVQSILSTLPCNNGYLGNYKHVQGGGTYPPILSPFLGGIGIILQNNTDDYKNVTA